MTLSQRDAADSVRFPLPPLHACSVTWSADFAPGSHYLRYCEYGNGWDGYGRYEWVAMGDDDEGGPKR